MEIIAQAKGGYLIQATLNEVQELFSAVTGKRPKESEIEIGHKIPAIDYASTIRSIQALKSDYDFKELLTRGRNMQRALESFEKAVISSEKIGKP